MTTRFQLDKRLQQDCVELGDWRDCLLLLMNNSLVPWYIVVPRTDIKELCQLPAALRADVDRNVDELSRFILAEFEITKLNIAAIGNVVSQLHIHVIGRYPGDYCWPGVVWGRDEKQPYTELEITQIKSRVNESLFLQ